MIIKDTAIGQCAWQQRFLDAKDKIGLDMERIYFGADHGGFELKRRLIELIKPKGYELVDMGPAAYNKDDDYVDYAEKVCKEVVSNKARGVLICKSGHGMAITANKFKGIYASVCWNAMSAVKAKKDDNINVLCLPGELITLDDAQKAVVSWLETPFESIERRNRRLEKVKGIEDRNFKQV